MCSRSRSSPRRSLTTNCTRATSSGSARRRIASSAAGSAAKAASLPATRARQRLGDTDGAQPRGLGGQRGGRGVAQRAPGGRRRPPRPRDGTARRWGRAPGRRRDAPASAPPVRRGGGRRGTARPGSRPGTRGRGRRSPPRSWSPRRRRGPRRAPGRGPASGMPVSSPRRDRKLMPARLTTAFATTVATISRRSGCESIAASYPERRSGGK